MEWKHTTRGLALRWGHAPEAGTRSGAQADHSGPLGLSRPKWAAEAPGAHGTEDRRGKVCVGWEVGAEVHLEVSCRHWPEGGAVRPRIRAFVPRRKNRATQ